MPARKEPDKSTYSGRFAIRLRMLREKAGLTPEQVAETTGVHVRTVYRWEAGKAEPTINQIVLLAEMFEITIGKLFPKKD